MAIFHEYPYTNFHDLNLDWIIKIVKELKAIVDQIDVDTINAHFAQIDEILATHAADIELLKSQSTAAAAAIEALQTTVSGMQVDIAQIHAAIDGVIEQIQAAVSELSGDVSELQTELDTYKTATNSRLETLEQAAFDPSQIVMSNNPFNFAISTLNGNTYGMRIVVDGSGAASDSIQWVDGGQFKPYGLPEKQKFNSTFKIPRFYNSGNQCHLVIPSVFPIVYRAAVNWTLYFYANRWIGETSTNIGIAKVGPINFTDLLAEGGYSKTGSSDSGSACFNEMELFPNQETGCYDLYIYNGRNGHYSWINDYIFSSLMILPIDLGNVSQTAGIQKYFNLLNTFQIQTNTTIDSKINTAVQNARVDLEGQISAVNSKFGDYLSPYGLHSETFTPSTGVTLVNNRTFAQYDIITPDGETPKMIIFMFIDLVLDIADLTDSDLTVGAFDMSLWPITNGRNLNVDTQSPNSGCYGTISQTGSCAIHCNGTFGDSTRVRITGTIAEAHEVAL